MWFARIAYERTKDRISPVKACFLERAAKASGGCPSDTTLSYGLVRWSSAPRRVLMRCLTRGEVVEFLTGHLCLLQGVSVSFCDPMSTMGKLSVSYRQSTQFSHWYSSSKQSLLGWHVLLSDRFKHEKSAYCKGAMRQPKVPEESKRTNRAQCGS